MAADLTPDICVIGGGPGGIAAALAAATAGASVVLVERNRIGGNNLTSGTVPSKALLAAAAVHESLRAGPGFGVTGAPLQVNLPRVREHIEAATEAIARSVSAERLAAQGVNVVSGNARFANPDLVAVETTGIRARHVILAAGSVVPAPAIPGLDAAEPMSFADGFQLTRRPTHLIVLGAGRHALELAQAYARLGIDATVIDEAAALPDDDPELAAIVVDRLRAEGISVRAGVKISEVVRRRGGIRVTIADPVEGEINIEGSHILVATARAPDVEGLGLPAAGIEWNPAGIVVDNRLRTTNRRVYAIGDAVAGPALAMRARDQATAVVGSILRRAPARDDATTIPVVAFTDPGLASIGMTESVARARHPDVRVLRYPFIENDLAQIERDPVGMIKVIASPGGGRIYGAAIVGRNAGELIAPWALAVANRLGLAAMTGFVPPYPTRSEIAGRVAAGLAMAARPGLTGQWSKRIIGLFR